MRICISLFQYAEGGGIERYLDYLSRYLCHQGHSLHVLCARQRMDAVHPQIQVTQLRPPIWQPGLGKAGKLLAFARAVERHVAGADYDVVLGLDKTWSQDVLRLGGGLHRTFLQAMHGGHLPTRLRARDRASLQIQERAFAPGQYRRIIVNSDMVGRELSSQYDVPEHAIERIYNGTDLERFHPHWRERGGRELRASLGWTSSAPVYLFLGSGFARKGFDLALAAFAAISDEQPSACLLVVGADDGLDDYRQQVAQMGLSSRVQFLGRRGDVEDCYAAADLFILPTRYDPFANATIEALASGLPVLTTRSNGGAELVQPGRNGDVFDFNDGAAALAAAMRGWAEPLKLAQGRVAARNTAEQHPIAGKMAAAEALLRQVADEKSTRAQP